MNKPHKLRLYVGMFMICLITPACSTASGQRNGVSPVRMEASSSMQNVERNIRCVKIVCSNYITQFR